MSKQPDLNEDVDEDGEATGSDDVEQTTVDVDINDIETDPGFEKEEPEGGEDIDDGEPFSKEDIEGDELKEEGEEKEEGFGVENSVNRGLARASVMKLPEGEEKDELEEEFEDVFRAFNVGYYASECAERYLMVDKEEDVHPVMGLLGGLTITALIVIHARPDTAEIKNGMRRRLSNVRERLVGEEEEEEEEQIDREKEKELERQQQSEQE